LPGEKSMGINLDNFGGATPFRWTHEYLTAFLTTGKHRVIKQPLLRNSFRQIRREDFVPDELQSSAYEDRELQIGFGEVINMPTITAHMLSLLKPRLGGKYLEIGTGSGWSAALLALATGEAGFIYTIERIQFLTDIARINLSKYPGLKNIKVIFGDGSDGLKQFAPFDGIYISAAYKKIPHPLMLQLTVGGRMVIPTVDHDLVLIERVSPDQFEQTVEKGYFFKPVAGGIE